MAKGLIDRLLEQVFDAEWVGRRGEKLTERELKLVKLFGRDGKVLRNVYVPKGDGETSEIDVLFITQKGVFVIESKNYSGWVFGSEADRNWTVSLPNGQKNYFYNPIRQNRGHVKWLERYLADGTPLFSIIVFSERCELKRVTVESDDADVVKRDRLYATVRRIWDSVEDVFSIDEVDSLYERLRVLTDVDEAVKRSHVDKIHACYAEKKTAPFSLTCPLCGADLVLRMAKKGPNAGNQFYGCSSYPKCRYTKNV